MKHARPSSLPFNLLPIAITSKDGHFLRVNRSFCELLGFSSKELLTKNLEDVTLNYTGITDCFLPFFIHGELEELIHKVDFETKENLIVNAEVIIKSNKNERGDFLNLSITIQQIHKENKTNEFVSRIALKIGEQNQEDFFKSATNNLLQVLDMSCVMICLLSEDRKKSNVRLMWENNQFFRNITFDNAQTPCKEVIEKGITVHPNNLNDTFGKCFFIQDRNYISFIGIPIYNFEKKCIGHVVVLDRKPIKDVEAIIAIVLNFSNQIGLELERLNYLKQIQKTNYRYQVLFDNSTDGIIISDYQENTIIGYNLQALMLFRISAQELEKINNCLDFSPEYQPDGSKSEDLYEEIFNRAFSTRQIQEYRWLYKRPDGSEFDAEVILMPFDQNIDIRKWMVVIKDLTEVKISKDRLKKLEELKLKEIENVNQRAALQSELDYRNRELSSTLLLDSYKSNLLSSMRDSLKKISENVDPNAKKEIKKILRDIDRNTNFDEEWQKFQLHFEEVHPNFFSKLSDRFPGLNAKQLRHCAYVKLGLSPKETAQLLHIEPKSIEMARYRLKMKTGFDSAERFVDFIKSL